MKNWINAIYTTIVGLENTKFFVAMLKNVQSR